MKKYSVLVKISVLFAIFLIAFCCTFFVKPSAVSSAGPAYDYEISYDEINDYFTVSVLSTPTNNYGTFEEAVNYIAQTVQPENVVNFGDLTVTPAAAAGIPLPAAVYIGSVTFNLGNGDLFTPKKGFVLNSGNYTFGDDTQSLVLSSTGQWNYLVEVTGGATLNSLGNSLSTAQFNSRSLFIDENSSAVLSNTTINAEGENSKSIYNFGTVTVGGGSISSQQGTAIVNYGSLTVNTGNISSTVCAIDSFSDAVINGGTITSSGGITIRTNFDSNLTVTGGTISESSSTNSCISNNGGNVNISGGTITASGVGAKCLVNSGNESILNISGGTLEATDTSTTVSVNSAIQAINGVVNITGGLIYTASLKGYAVQVLDNASMTIGQDEGKTTSISAPKLCILNQSSNQNALTINGGSIKTSQSNATVINCKGATVINGGEISSEGTTSTTILNDNCIITMNGGTVESEQAGSVSIKIDSSGGTFTMYNGNILAANEGVRLSAGSFTMAGGQLSSDGIGFITEGESELLIYNYHPDIPTIVDAESFAITTDSISADAITILSDISMRSNGSSVIRNNSTGGINILGGYIYTVISGSTIIYNEAGTVTIDNDADIQACGPADIKNIDNVSGTLNINGGQIINSSETYSDESVCVISGPGSTLNVSDDAIIRNIGEGGFGVDLIGATFTMNGGTVESTNSYSVALKGFSATATINSGIIRTSGETGIEKTAVNILDSTITVNGGSINNMTSSNANTVFYAENSDVIITGGGFINSGGSGYAIEVIGTSELSINENEPESLNIFGQYGIKMATTQEECTITGGVIQAAYKGILNESVATKLILNTTALITDEGENSCFVTTAGDVEFNGGVYEGQVNVISAMGDVTINDGEFYSNAFILKCNASNGIYTINDGILTTTNSFDNYVIYLGAGNSFVMTGGAISASNNGIECFSQQENAIDISGGEIISKFKSITINESSAVNHNVNISGGLVKSIDSQAISCNNDFCTVNISGGIVDAENSETIVMNNGSLNISGGTVDCQKSISIVMNEGLLNITGGTITNLHSGCPEVIMMKGSSKAVIDEVNNEVPTLITGNSGISVFSSNAEPLTFSGGKIETEGNSIKNEGSGIVTIDGGVIRSDVLAILARGSGTVNIEGGDISVMGGSNKADILDNDHRGMAVYVEGSATVNISDGLICSYTDSDGEFATAVLASSGTVNITGGDLISRNAGFAGCETVSLVIKGTADVNINSFDISNPASLYSDFSSIYVDDSAENTLNISGCYFETKYYGVENWADIVINMSGCDINTNCDVAEAVSNDIGIKTIIGSVNINDSYFMGTKFVEIIQGEVNINNTNSSLKEWGVVSFGGTVTVSGTSSFVSKQEKVFFLNKESSGVITLYGTDINASDKADIAVKAELNVNQDLEISNENIEDCKVTVDTLYEGYTFKGWSDGETMFSTTIDTAIGEHTAFILLTRLPVEITGISLSG